MIGGEALLLAKHLRRKGRTGFQDFQALMLDSP